MKRIVVDYENGNVNADGNIVDISSSEAFDIISDAYLKIGWQNKHVYSFTWMGRPIIQLPEDIVRIQEIVYDVKPDFIIETGIAHGGSLIFYASLLKAIGKGKVIGIDIDIREHNKVEIERHELIDLITMHESSSTDINTIDKITKEIQDSGIKNPKVMVVLDACHTREHSLEELRLYSKFVNQGSYIIVCDGGIMERMTELPNAINTETDWAINNPKKAAEDFVLENTNFEIVKPDFKFNEGSVRNWHSYWQGGIIRKK